MGIFSGNLSKIEFQKIGTINGGQDGAIWNGYIFRINTKGCCVVTEAETLCKVSEFVLDKCDYIIPHSNSVCFGNEYFSADDEIPLLYANIYNNYQNCDDKKEGMCCVYRITKSSRDFSSRLVQLIKIDFTNEGLWRSENTKDVRPYGNFVIDKKNNVFYAFVMRDEDYKTRVFSFNLPKLSDGRCGENDFVNVVKLSKKDIISMFDCEYVEYMQGAAFADNYIFSVNGFGKDSEHKPTLSIIDTINQKTVATIRLDSYGLTHEPEFIDVYDKEVWYSDCCGNLYKFRF